VYFELRDIEQGYAPSFPYQVIVDSKRELCGLRDIPGVRGVAGTRGQQQDIVLRFKMPDEPRARLAQTALARA